MGKYGEAAIEAATLAAKSGHPVEAWKLAAIHKFPDSKSSRDKGCPRAAFLGLCEDGYVRGVRPGSYTRSANNKRYAVDALLILKADPHLANSSVNQLWKRVMQGTEKKHNYQMDIVLALWWAGKLKV